MESGVSEDKVIIDPGIGFGKTFEHNLVIIHRQKNLLSGKPVHRSVEKAFIGRSLSVPPEDRLEGTAAVIAVSIMTVRT
jgi:dihydropteroate synthase